MSKRKDICGSCCYCGRPSRLTTDHVPPKSLFAPENRHDLVRVLACANCNSDASKDEEYFRLAVTLRHDVGDDPNARWANTVALRSLRRADHKGLRAATLGSLGHTELWRSGIYLGMLPAYYVDLRRLDTVVEKIVAGLYWHEYGHMIPATHQLHVWGASRYEALDIWALLGFHKLSMIALSGLRRSLGAGSFDYAVWRSSDEPASTVWLLRLYARVHFVAVTVRRDIVETGGPESGAIAETPIR